MLLVTVMKSNLPCDWAYSGKKKNKKKQVCLTSQISHCLLSLHSTSRQNSVEFSYQVTSLLTDTLDRTGGYSNG